MRDLDLHRNMLATRRVSWQPTALACFAALHESVCGTHSPSRSPKVHVRERYYICRRQVLAGTGEVDPKGPALSVPIAMQHFPDHVCDEPWDLISCSRLLKIAMGGR